MHPAGLTSLVAFSLLLLLMVALAASRRWIEEDVIETNRARQRHTILDKLRDARTLLDQSERFAPSSDPIQNLSSLTRATVLVEDAVALARVEDEALTSFCEFDVKALRAQIAMRLAATQNFLREQVLAR